MYDLIKLLHTKKKSKKHSTTSKPARIDAQGVKSYLQKIRQEVEQNEKDQYSHLKAK